MEKESLGPESLAEKFKNGNGLEQYYGKWLLLSGMSPDAEDNLAKTREIPLIRAISGCGNVDTKEIFNSWYKGGRAGTKINQQLLSEEGLAVGEALVFKASSTQSFGNKAKYLAFGTRPTKSVEEMYPKIWSESSSSASSPSGDTSTTSAAANSSSSSSSRKVQKVDSALSSSPEVTSPHGATRPMRTPRPSLPRDYFVYNANDDDETVEAAMEECVQGGSKKRRRTRATTPAESGEAREGGPRDRKSGRFSSSK
mmetsp:Transcript_87518/g.169548  ORF Transcript_87518/g.169548 Transcript_87518/m.169548 type:complete len:255 (-) Transcript_87518:1254-2018(-)